MYLKVGVIERYKSKAWISSEVIVVAVDITWYNTDRIQLLNLLQERERAGDQGNALPRSDFQVLKDNEYTGILLPK